MGSFSGIYISLSSLYAQRQALDTTGQNIANANTEGYSRQRVSMSSIGGLVVPAMHARTSATGLGVRIDGVERLRDMFLEARGQRESGTLARMSVAQEALGRVELVLAEPSETSIGAQLAEFWSGWDDVANRPDDIAAKAQVVERATTLATGLNQTVQQLDALSADALAQLDALTKEVNAVASRVAELNGTIQSAVKGGFSPNDLFDQRDLLVNKLAELVGGSTRAGADGMVDVFVAGTALVRGRTAETLGVTGNGPTSVMWTKDDFPAELDGGKGAGLLDVINNVIPAYRVEINAVSQNVLEWVNYEYRATTAPPPPTPATPPADPGPPEPQFFVRLSNGRLAVNPAIVADPSTITAGYAAGTLDGSRAQRIANLLGPDELYRGVIVRLGVDAQTANRRVEIQGSILEQVDAAREAEAGVNLDEEMANMVAFQHAYNAAARMMTAMDEALDVLINRTGLIGR